MGRELTIWEGDPGAAAERGTLREQARAPATERAAAYQWALFAGWCSGEGRVSLPADASTVEAYLEAVAARGTRGKGERGIRTAASAGQAVWAINREHRRAGHAAPGAQDHPRLALAGFRRGARGSERRAAALSVVDLRAIGDGRGEMGARDVAMIRLGWAGLLRRSEVAALDLADVRWGRSGIEVRVRAGKGAEAVVSVVRGRALRGVCPVAALERWLRLRGSAAGPLFVGLVGRRRGRRLSGAAVDAAVRRVARNAGLAGGGYSGHSLRAGGATWLAEAGVSPLLVAQHGRWRRMDTVIGYCRADQASVLRGVW
jgi:integrase